MADLVLANIIDNSFKADLLHHAFAMICMLCSAF